MTDKSITGISQEAKDLFKLCQVKESARQEKRLNADRALIELCNFYLKGNEKCTQ